MKKYILFLFFLGAAFFVTAAQVSTVKSDAIVFTNVNVIPMDKERVLKNKTVLVRDGRIAEIGDEGKVKIPADAVKIDARGKFLMPGIVDMHLHLSPGEGVSDDLPSQQIRLLLANGVTTMRNMIGHPSHLVLRDKINRGETIAPQIFTAGPPLLINNTPTVDAAIKSVTEQKKAGYDLIKVHEGLTPEIYEAIVKIAREAGIPFAGHVTATVGLNRALAAKQTSIEHLDNYLQSAISPNAKIEITPAQIVLGETLENVDEKKLAELAKETAKTGVANTPTLTLFKIVVSNTKPEEYLNWEEMKYVPAQMRQNFAKQKGGTLGIPGSAEEKKRYLELRNSLVRELYKAGVKILVGPDSPQLFLVPGFATHREMQALSEAGLSNYAVLEAATKNGAENLGMLKEIGTIEKGKGADLLLLDANPLENIANARKIAGVMVRGNWLPKENLAKMLEEVAALHRETKAETSGKTALANNTTTVIVLRHAEIAKDGTPDPPLNENGKKQVQDLIKTLENAEIAAVFTTQFKRTFDTGKPLGEKFGVSVVPIEISGQNINDYHNLIAERIFKEYAGKTVVVIGHSNTVPPVVQALSGKAVAPIDDATEFDALFVVSSRGKGDGSVVRTRYGRADGTLQ